MQLVLTPGAMLLRVVTVELMICGGRAEAPCRCCHEDREGSGRNGEVLRVR